jgi:methylmalonyl-CoA mutase N-terminal domain/subunit
LNKQNPSEEIKSSEEDLIKAVLDSPKEQHLHETLSGLPIENLYTPKNFDASKYVEQIGLPGEFPFTRGVHATGYRGKTWTMRMFAGFGTPKNTNERFKFLLANGESGLSTAFDMPTLYGYDTDDERAAGEFGKCGVAVSSLWDMQELFEGIPLESITTSMTINSPAAIIWAMYIVAAQKQGISIKNLGGTLQNDILKEYHAQNEYIFPPEPSMRLVTDTIEFATKEMPKWNPISVSGYHMREAGSTAVQELAFTLADGFEYIDWALERGLKIDEFGPRISFFWNVEMDFFEEICKMRAARRIWAKTLKNKYHALDPKTLRLRCHAQTSGVSLTAQQPNLNVARVTIQALAAVLAGTQSLHTNSLDEAWALPSEEAVLTALRTQQIIADETGVTNTVDPLGGSYLIESLTDTMEEKCLEYFRKIDGQGGVIACIKNNYIVQEIAESSYRIQRQLESKERIIVGVNKYLNDDIIEIPLLKVDEKGKNEQIHRLNQLKRTRDNKAVSRSLNNLETIARSQKNVMPALIQAVESLATLGEMMDSFRSVFGEH